MPSTGNCPATLVTDAAFVVSVSTTITPVLPVTGLFFGSMRLGPIPLSYSLLGVTERKDGTEQVTYNGHPLYGFVEDKKPGEANGNNFEGFGAEWYALNSAGEEPGSGGSEEEDSGTTTDESGGGYSGY